MVWESSNFTSVTNHRSKMKKPFAVLFMLGIFLTAFSTQTTSYPKIKAFSGEHSRVIQLNQELEKEAFEILEAKCNVCHRKQNPFMVFNLKNMAKRAHKIHKQVFIERRMPKGDEISLSTEEYSTLEKWLVKQNIL